MVRARKRLLIASAVASVGVLAVGTAVNAASRTTPATTKPSSSPSADAVKAEATPKGVGKGVKAAGRTSGTVSQAAREAVAHGPADLLVSVANASTASTVASVMAPGATKARREVATQAAAAGYEATKRAVLQSAGGSVTTARDYDHLPVQLVRVASAQALTALAAAPGVLAVDVPQRRVVEAVPPDLSLIHQPEAASAGLTGTGVRVAVLDTGVDWQLAGVGDAFGDCSQGPGTGRCRIDQYVDATNSGQNDVDPRHHGTNVSGVIAETAPGAHLSVYNVFTYDATTQHASAQDGDILGALNAVVRDAPTQNIRAVNMSLGTAGTNYVSECTDSIYSAAFLNLRALGVVPVVAAGNAGYDPANPGVESPACATGAVRVGAVYAQGSSGDRAWPPTGTPLCTDHNPAADSVVCFSQAGPLLSLLAPGVDVTAAGVTESGTSQATPHVAGAVADLVSANPQATAQQIVRALTTTGPSVTDARTGASVHRLDINAAGTAVRAPGAEIDDAGCTATPLPANDDESTSSVNLPFTADFFGTSYSALFVNNNGNVTFQGPQGTYTPFTINSGTPPMIAPFFADVDTRGTGSGLTTYGTTTYGSRPAFCVDWNNVGYFAGHTDKLNSFQLLLVDRGDIGAGDFDIVMNYGTLNWETGDASGGVHGYNGTPAGAGYSAGDGDTAHFFQFPGSLAHAGLLDSNSSTGLVNGSRGTLQPGRYIFPVRNGAAPGAARITGVVQDDQGVPQAGAPVQACSAAGGSCVAGFSGSDGHYTIVGVSAGSYALTAFPPASSQLLPGHAGPVAVATGSSVQQDLVLGSPHGPPAGTTITDRGTTANGVPIIYWTDPLTLTSSGCPGGTATYTVRQGTTVLASGPMTENPTGPGHYSGTIGAFYPVHGDAQVTIAFACPDASHPTVAFTVYIDPAGTVVNTLGAPISGAQVTLLRADTSSGPFSAVPDGDAVMSPSNRTNPVTTGSDGTFAWDVVSGFYQVRAAKAGCHPAGATGGDAPVTSQVYEVPPAALGIQLVLDCGESTGRSTTTLHATPAAPVVGQPVVLTADVAGDGAAPTGTVDFTGAPAVAAGCANRPVISGQATCTVTFSHATTGAVTLTAAYSGDAHHPASSGTLGVTVGKATPTITWTAPQPVTYPAALGATQLNAMADVAGTFTYTVVGSGATASGAVLHPGANQLLEATFTPTDTADYTTTAARVALTVLPGNQVITVDAPGAADLAAGTVSVVAHGGPAGPVTLRSSTPSACAIDSTTGTTTLTAVVRLVGAGTCTLLASQPGNSDWAAAQDVSVTIAVTVAARQPLLDRSVSRDDAHAGRQLTSARLTTHGGDELLLLFVSAAGPRHEAQAVQTVTGGGVVWRRIVRSNGASGSAEVWQAFSSQRQYNLAPVVTFKEPGHAVTLTLAAFTGAARTVASSAKASGPDGAPALTLTTTRGGLIWAAGESSTSAATVVTDPSQTVVHQFAPRSPGTGWVQSLAGTTAPGAPVGVGVLAPNDKPWNLAAVEIAGG